MFEDAPAAPPLRTIRVAELDGEWDAELTAAVEAALLAWFGSDDEEGTAGRQAVEEDLTVGADECWDPPRVWAEQEPPLAVTLERLVDEPSTPGASTFLAGLDAVDLSPRERVLVAQAWERQRRWVEARFETAAAACLAGGLGAPAPALGASATSAAAADSAVVELAEEWALQQGATPKPLRDLAAYARAEELRLALGQSTGEAYHGARRAVALAGPYRAARDALGAGLLSVKQLTALMDETRAVPVSQLPGLLTRVLPGAERMTTAQFRRRVGAVVARLRPEATAEEVASARAGRRLETDLRPETYQTTASGVSGTGTGTGVARERSGDGGPDEAFELLRTCRVTAVTDPVQAMRILRLVEGHARRMRASARGAATAALEEALHRQESLRAATGKGRGAAEMAAADTTVAEARAAREAVYARRLGTWRVDALEHLLGLGDAAVTAGQGVVTHGRPVQLVVVADLDTVTGLATNPVELRGYGTLPADVLAELQTAATRWLLTVTDTPHGAALAVDRYRPGAALQDWITATRPTCAQWGCEIPVEFTERDHVRPYDHDDPADGGATDAANLVPLCRGHHQLKTSGRYRTELLDDGTLITTTPAGLRYASTPPPLLPGHDVGADAGHGASPPCSTEPSGDSAFETPPF